MAYEKKPNEGALFANKDKQTDAHPNAKGDAVIGGIEYWVSAWTNTAQGSGERYQKLKFTPKDKQTQAAPQPEPEPFSDDIPF
jgi:hypothetical protein